ncbi:MAG TPA: hypothetical protein VFM18_11725 [Methanosarcina sp.]|nr:hypothetical protein [Methanosarcina sp.]
MKYTTYNPVTGEIIATISGSNIDYHLSLSTYIQGDFNSKTHYVDVNTKEPIEKPTDPSTELKTYHFDHTKKDWILHEDRTKQSYQNKLSNLLSEVDSISAVRYAGLSEDEKREVIEYRKQLVENPKDLPKRPHWL